MTPPIGFSPSLQLELRLLEELAHAMEKAVCRCTVDRPVIVGQREVHDGSDHEGVLAIHKPANVVGIICEMRASASLFRSEAG